jgi:hypothetical protein
MVALVLPLDAAQSDLGQVLTVLPEIEAVK